jgi:NADH-quinone oxidoreductase subunit N
MNFFGFQTLSADVNLTLILPEIAIGLAAVVVMLVDALVKRKQQWVTGGLSLAGIAISAGSALWIWRNPGMVSGASFHGMIIFDDLRMVFTMITLLIAALTILISVFWTEGEDLPSGEFHSLLLFATSGMLLMASGNDLVIIFLGIEILSIASYVMCGFRRTDLRSNESSLKYFILGSFSSAFLLYGIALTYGGTATATGLPGTTNITEIAERLAQADPLYPALLFAGVAMMIVGFGFKIALAPFHVWTPDVYEGAPTPVTAFMAAGPKAAGFASFLRVFVFGFPIIAAVSTVPGQVHSAWLGTLAVLAVITMCVGNIAAIAQNNVKRMLAYSSIAHAGYAMLGFVAAGAAPDEAQRNAALAATAFYLLTYAVMNLGAFAVVTLIARKGDRRTEFEDYNGIGFRAPVLAFTLSLFMLSLFGMPPTAGFTGKLMIFRVAIEAGYTKLVIIAVLNAALSAYYYLRLIVVMFFRDPVEDWRAPVASGAMTVVLVVTILGVFYLGLFPDRVLDVFAKPGTTTAVGRTR